MPSDPAARAAALLGAFALIALAGPARAEPGETAVGAAARTALSLAVYNADVALVHDLRRVMLAAGANDVAFTEVSGAMRPETAIIDVAGGADGIRVLAQDFEFDRLTPEALLRRSVGGTVRIVRTHPTTGEETAEEATVLSAADGVVLRVGDRIETVVPGRIVYDSLPEGLRPRPALVARLDSRRAAEVELALSYLTGGVSWQADYVAMLDEGGRRLDLAGYATLVNTSGADYADARLALVAGDIHLVGGDVRPMMARMAAAPEAAAADMAVEKAGDLHVFRIERPVTLADNARKQIALLHGRGIPVEKAYRVESAVAPARLPAPDRLPVGVRLTFANEATGGLGGPLPRGVVRVYQPQAEGGALFLGEDRIAHTPEGETVRLALGHAFDMTAERKQLAFSREVMGKNTFETTFEITLRNAGAEPATVSVVERIPGDWTMITESMPHEKTAASTAEWRVPVPAEGEARLTYRVRVRL